jgi:hypothetical protein
VLDKLLADCIRIKRRESIVAGRKMNMRVDYLKPQEFYLFDVKITTKNSMPDAVESKEGTHHCTPLCQTFKRGVQAFPIQCEYQTKATDNLVDLRAVVMAEAALKSSRQVNSCHYLHKEI